MSELTIREMTANMVALTAQIAEHLVTVRKGNLPAACRTFYRLKTGYEEFETERKKLGELVEQMSRATLPEMLEEAAVSNITVEIAEDIKFRFGKNQRFSCSMIDKDAGFAWLRSDESGGGEALIQETVNASTLASFAKTWIEDKGLDLPTDIFKTSTMTYVSITKA